MTSSRLPDGQVDQLTAAFVAAAQEAGFEVEALQFGPTFARLLVRRGQEAVSVDVGLDARIRPLEVSRLGPVLSREELAADKLLALFGRAEPRDFVDVMALEAAIGLARMCDLAAEKDRGFSRAQLAAMIERFDRFSAEEYGGDHTMFEQLRAATHRWLDQLGVEPPDLPWRWPSIAQQARRSRPRALAAEVRVAMVPIPSTKYGPQWDAPSAPEGSRRQCRGPGTHRACFGACEGLVMSGRRDVESLGRRPQVSGPRSRSSAPWGGTAPRSRAGRPVAACGLTR